MTPVDDKFKIKVDKKFQKFVAQNFKMEYNFKMQEINNQEIPAGEEVFLNFIVGNYYNKLDKPKANKDGTVNEY